MVEEYIHTVNVLRETKGSRPNPTVLVGFEDQILPALLAGADDAIRGLSNIAPKLFNGLVRRPSTAATSRKRRSCTGASSPSWRYTP
jgi:dihydrodipicolinate synthase/N-acetylneuraminate lyase